MNGPQKPPYDVRNILKDPYFRQWLPKWHINVMENYPQIKKDFQVDSNLKAHKDCCISNVAGEARRPAIILGSGPSINEIAPLLKKWQHPIFAPTSAAFIPVKWGREPEYVAAYDSHWSLLENLKGHKWEKTTLLVQPYAEPKLLKWWKWEKMYFRRRYPNMEFSELILPMMLPWVRVGIRVTGNVTNTLITIANYWGYSPIFLIGIDLGWLEDGNNRATYYRPEKDGWKTILPRDEETVRKRWDIVQIEHVRTKEMFMTFKFQLMQMWKADKMPVIDCSGGLLFELPKADLKEVIKRQGHGYENIIKKDGKEISLIVDDFAAKFQAFNKKIQKMKEEKKEKNK